MSLSNRGQLTPNWVSEEDAQFESGEEEYAVLSLAHGHD